MTYRRYVDKVSTPVDPKALSKFRSEVEELARRTFGVDWERWCPVAVDVIDRTRYEKAYWDHLEHNNHDDGMEQARIAHRNLRVAAGNVSTAAEQLRRAQWLVHDIEEKRSKGKKAPAPVVPDKRLNWSERKRLDQLVSRAIRITKEVDEFLGVSSTQRHREMGPGKGVGAHGAVALLMKRFNEMKAKLEGK